MRFGSHILLVYLRARESGLSRRRRDRNRSIVRVKGLECILRCLVSGKILHPILQDCRLAFEFDEKNHRRAVGRLENWIFDRVEKAKLKLETRNRVHDSLIWSLWTVGVTYFWKGWSEFYPSNILRWNFKKKSTKTFFSSLHSDNFLGKCWSVRSYEF